MRNVGFVHNIVALKSYSGKGSKVMTYTMMMVIVSFQNLSTCLGVYLKNEILHFHEEKYHLKEAQNNSVGMKYN